MVWKKLALILVFALMFLPLIYSAPPTTTVTDYQRGVDIIHPETQLIKSEKDLEFNFWTYNNTNGATLTNTSLNCTLYILDNTGNQFYRFSNQAGANGLMTYGKGAPLCVNCWTMTLPKENISNGLYSYQIKCQGTQIGGYTTGSFEVTTTGVDLTEGRAILYIGLIAIFVLILLALPFIINMLPSQDSRDEQGQIIQINWLKYFRPALWLVEWVLALALVFLVSNVAYAYLVEELFANYLFTIFQIGMGITPVLVILMFIWVGMRFFSDKNLQQLLNRGFSSNGF